MFTNFKKAIQDHFAKLSETATFHRIIQTGERKSNYDYN